MRYLESMEPVQPQQSMPVVSHSDVGFPPQTPPPGSKQNGGGGKMVKFAIAIIGVVLIVGIGGVFIFSSGGEGGTEPSPTPGVDSLSTFPTPQPTTAPSSPTPEAKPVDKSEVSIEVLNGTGTPGDAGALSDALEEAGFSEITAGNADEQDATAAVATYSRDLPQSVVDEITAVLEDMYEEVTTRKATLSGDYDASIVTGTKKSSAASSPKASPSPSPTSSTEE